MTRPSNYSEEFHKRCRDFDECHHRKHGYRKPKRGYQDSVQRGMRSMRKRSPDKPLIISSIDTGQQIGRRVVILRQDT